MRLSPSNSTHFFCKERSSACHAGVAPRTPRCQSERCPASSPCRRLRSFSDWEATAEAAWRHSINEDAASASPAPGYAALTTALTAGADCVGFAVVVFPEPRRGAI